MTAAKDTQGTEFPLLNLRFLNRGVDQLIMTLRDLAKTTIEVKLLEEATKFVKETSVNDAEAILVQELVLSEISFDRTRITATLARKIALHDGVIQKEKRIAPVGMNGGLDE